MGAALFKRGWGVSNWITPWFHGPWGRLLERWCFYVKAIPSRARCRWGFIRVHTVPRFVAVHDVHGCTFMEAFSIKINTEGCLVSSLCLFSLFHRRSVSVLSLVGRRLSITLSLSLVKSCSLFFFFSLSLSRMGSAPLFVIIFPVSFFSFALFPALSFSPFDSCFVSVSFFIVFRFSFFPPFPPRYCPSWKIHESRESRWNLLAALN